MCFSNLVHSDAEPRSQQETQQLRIFTRKFKNVGVLPGNSGIQDSYQEVQESRIPTRKFKNPEFLPGNLRIQDFWQEIQDFPGSQTLGCHQNIEWEKISPKFWLA